MEASRSVLEVQSTASDSWRIALTVITRHAQALSHDIYLGKYEEPWPLLAQESPYTNTRNLGKIG